MKEEALVTSPISYTVTVFDLPSLFATKLHALFCRRYTKGRDYYDLVWYLGRKVRPNFQLLNNAIHQTQKEPVQITESNFKSELIRHLDSVDFKKIKSEVERFLIDQKESEFLEPDKIKSLLRNYP